ncbi:MAG: hypothetical protein V1724_01880, partial [Chloroflexota bacterium]
MQNRMKIMKRRWLLLIGLALALATQLALPAIAYAAPQQKFTGEGTLTITYMPDPVFLAPKLLLFKDETVVGTIQTCDGLPALVGAELYSVHTTLARVDWSTMDMKGALKGTFTLTASNGDVMKGAMVATQEGNLLG